MTARPKTIAPPSDCGCLGPQVINSIHRGSGRVQHVDLSKAIRHLTYHVWPTKQHDFWKWNLEQIAQRWPLFNGRKALGIVYDYRSHFPDVVKAECERLGLAWDFTIVRRNSAKLGEVKTWIQRLESLSPQTAQPNEVVFAAHAKGVRHDYGAVEPWCRIMYEACLDNWDAVRQQLEYGIMSGAFKQGRDGWRWEYSGSFYWFRLYDIGRRNWRNIEPHYAGTETWPAVQCRREEAGCLFASDAGNAYAGHRDWFARWERMKHALGYK